MRPQVDVILPHLGKVFAVFGVHLHLQAAGEDGGEQCDAWQARKPSPATRYFHTLVVCTFMYCISSSPVRYIDIEY